MALAPLRPPRVGPTSTRHAARSPPSTPRGILRRAQVLPPRCLPLCTTFWMCTTARLERLAAGILDRGTWLHESSTTALLATSWQPSAAALRTRLTSSQQAGKPSPATFADVELQSNLGRLSPMALQAPPAASTGSLSWQPAGNPWWPPSSQQTCSPGAPASRTSSSTSLVSPATGLMPRAASTAGQPALGRCPLPKPR